MHFLKCVALLMPIITMSTFGKVLQAIKAKDLADLLLRLNTNPVKTDVENVNNKGLEEKPVSRASPIIVLSLGGKTVANEAKKSDVDDKKAIRYLSQLMHQNTKNARGIKKDILRSVAHYESTTEESSSKEFNTAEKKMFENWRQNFSCAGSTYKPPKIIDKDTLRPLRYEKVNSMMNQIINHKRWKPGHPIFPQSPYKGIVRPLSRRAGSGAEPRTVFRFNELVV